MRSVAYAARKDCPTSPFGTAASKPPLSPTPFCWCCAWTSDNAPELEIFHGVLFVTFELGAGPHCPDLLEVDLNQQSGTPPTH